MQSSASVETPVRSSTQHATIACTSLCSKAARNLIVPFKEIKVASFAPSGMMAVWLSLSRLKPRMVRLTSDSAAKPPLVTLPQL